MEEKNVDTNEQASELADEALEGLSGGLAGNRDVPAGHIHSFSPMRA